MPTKTKLRDSERVEAARMVAQFSVMVHGWRRNDFRQAATAQEELERLGVRVRIPRRAAAAV